MTGYEPSYRAYYHSGRLQSVAESMHTRLYACNQCPRHCGVDRHVGADGYCSSSVLPKIASHTIHHGEEPPISGKLGSGTIFFSHCTLACRFCQNYPISHFGNGNVISIAQLAAMMMELQDKKAHNINFVTPTHSAHTIPAALLEAVPKGFNLPIVYNTSGYDDMETLQFLDGVIDIYMPDIKYNNNDTAYAHSDCGDYVEKNRAALIEMFRQVGLLQCDSHGIALRGMIIRHLVIPGGIAESKECLRFIAEALSPNITVSIMSQYFPAHTVLHDAVLGRRLHRDEYNEVVEYARSINLENALIQPL